VDVIIFNNDVAEIDTNPEGDAAVLALRSVIPRCTSIAQRTASTTLANSAR
jgi:hypothetical protein